MTSTSDQSILIIGEQADPHINKVCSHLTDLRAVFTVFDPFQTVLVPEFNHPNHAAGYKAIWDRLKPISTPKSTRGQYIVRERLGAVRSLQLIHDQARQMNPFLGTEAARSKIFQLRTAEELGIETPRTYLGNDATHVRRFVSGFKHGAIAKSLTWFYDGSAKFSFTRNVTPEALQSDAEIACSPMIYQEYIKKRFELRITCVSRKVFAVRIFSQSNGKTLVD